MRFKLDLSTTSVNKLLQALKATEDKIATVVSKALQQLGEMGVVNIGRLLTVYGLGDSDVARSVELIKVNDSHFRIRATGKMTDIGVCQAVLLEFGTGIVGERQPHQVAAEFGYKYDINAHGDAGWFYPTTLTDRNPRKYVTKKGDVLAWTKGMPSRPFMYNTSVYLLSEAPYVLRGVIKELLA